MRWFCAALLLVCGFVSADGCLVPGLPAQEKAKLDKQDLAAKDAAEQFIKAVWKQDLDGAMKVADAPFFWDGVENIQDREGLQAKIKGLLKKDRSKIPFETKAVYTFGKLPAGFAPKKELELLNKILEKTDRVVSIEFKPPGRDGIAIMVRLRDEKAKVAGFRD